MFDKMSGNHFENHINMTNVIGTFCVADQDKIKHHYRAEGFSYFCKQCFQTGTLEQLLGTLPTFYLNIDVNREIVKFLSKGFSSQMNMGERIAEDQRAIFLCTRKNF